MSDLCPVMQQFTSCGYWECIIPANEPHIAHYFKFRPKVREICPECSQGKCRNCTQYILNRNDDLVSCECSHG